MPQDTTPATSISSVNNPSISKRRVPKLLAIIAISLAALVCIFLIIKSSGGLVSQTSLGGITSSHSLADDKSRTAELERQRQMQAKLLREQRITAEVVGIEGQLAVLRQSLSVTQAELAAHLTKTNHYAMQHKAAIAAMGASVVGAVAALDDSSKLNDDQKTGAGLVSVAGGLYALFNAEECAQVVDEMARSASLQADYESRISKTKSEIRQLQSRIDHAKVELQQ